MALGPSMRTGLLAGVLGLGVGLSLAATPAAAASRQPSYFGTWLIAEAHPAPWVVPGDPSTEPYDAQLVGKTIVYEKRRIVAPSPLACDSSYAGCLRTGAWNASTGANICNNPAFTPYPEG